MKIEIKKNQKKRKYYYFRRIINRRKNNMSEKQNDYISARFDFAKFLLSEDLFKRLDKQGLNIKDEALNDIVTICKKVFDDVEIEIKHQKDLENKRLQQEQQWMDLNRHQLYINAGLIAVIIFSNIFADVNEILSWIVGGGAVGLGALTTIFNKKK